MFENSFEFVNDFLTFESRQSAKLQIENRLRLNVGKAKFADNFFEIFAERFGGFVARWRAAPRF